MALYEEFGHVTYDEVLPQIDHALQTAALAANEAASEELILAALLHDVGHLLAVQAGRAEGESAAVAQDLTHEAVGARYLAGLFPPAVTGPIALHVRAKRYICAMHPEYLEGLSTGSVRSLKLQGGPMSTAELRVFERNPASANAVRLRHWDDGAKFIGLEIAPLCDYLEMLQRVSFTSP